MKPTHRLHSVFQAGLSLVVAGVIDTTARAQTSPSQDQAAQPPLPAQLTKDDANQNAELDLAKKRALVRERMLQRREQRAARARAAAEARKAELAAHYAKQKISPALLEQYDRNQNGRLDSEEWARHRQDLQRRRAEQQGQSAAPQPPPAQPPPAPAAPAPQ
jgi:hypothetical protein